MLDEILAGTQTPFPTILLRLSLAAGFGGIIGLERQIRQKSVGLRTHMLVALGAATFILLAMEMVHAVAQLEPPIQMVAMDPVRALEALLSALALLGAGTILQGRHGVHGVTTGVGIWVSGAIGGACGAGIYGLAVVAFVFGLIILALIGAAEDWLLPSNDSEDNRE